MSKKFLSKSWILFYLSCLGTLFEVFCLLLDTSSSDWRAPVKAMVDENFLIYALWVFPSLLYCALFLLVQLVMKLKILKNQSLKTGLSIFLYLLIAALGVYVGFTLPLMTVVMGQVSLKMTVWFSLAIFIAVAFVVERFLIKRKRYWLRSFVVGLCLGALYLTAFLISQSWQIDLTL